MEDILVRSLATMSSKNETKKGFEGEVDAFFDYLRKRCYNYSRATFENFVATAQNALQAIDAGQQPTLVNATYVSQESQQVTPMVRHQNSADVSIPLDTIYVASQDPTFPSMQQESHYEYVYPQDTQIATITQLLPSQGAHAQVATTSQLLPSQGAGLQDALTTTDTFDTLITSSTSKVQPPTIDTFINKSVQSAPAQSAPMQSPPQTDVLCLKKTTQTAADSEQVHDGECVDGEESQTEVAEGGDEHNFNFMESESESEKVVHNEERGEESESDTEVTEGGDGEGYVEPFIPLI